MAYQVCDIRPSTGMSRGQSNEHLRNFSQRAYENKVTRNFDPTREHLNFEVTKGGKIIPVDKTNSIVSRIKQNLTQRGIDNPNIGLSENDPKRRKIIADFILQGSREQMRKLAFGEQTIDENTLDHTPDNSHLVRMPEIEEWAKDMYKFVCKRFGEENIPAFVIHLDEKNPHIHCTVLTIGMVKGKERFSWSAIFGKNKYEGIDIFKNIHDELAKVNIKWGLERGRDIHQTGAKHRTTEEYWRWLNEKCNELENEKFGKEKTMKLLESEIAKAERRVKGLTTMIENLNKKLEDIEQQISQKQVSSAMLDVLMKNKEKIEADIADKKEKLNKANEQLWEISDKYGAIEKEYDKMQKNLYKVNSEIKDTSLTWIESFAWNLAMETIANVKKELMQITPEMTPEEKESFDKYNTIVFKDNFLEEMAEKGNEIVAVAASLFLGYIDQATSFAESQGGGGGGSVDSNWGRKKDEDEFAFMRRCFGAARLLMKPTGKKLKR